MIWFAIAAALLTLLIILSALRVSSDLDDRMEIDETKFLTPEVTPAPAADPTDAEPTPPPVTWTRYPVALDDDLQRYIEEQCREKEIEASIVFAMIGVESGFHADKIGDGGESFGMMQIYKACHEDRMERLGVTDLLDPRQNVTVGIDLLAELLDMGKGMEWALMAYNAGPVRADRYLEQGVLTGYAYNVMRNAECLLESAQSVTE